MQNKRTLKPAETTLPGILYRVAESSQVWAEERMKEDIDLCEKFLVALQVGVVPEDI